MAFNILYNLQLQLVTRAHYNVRKGGPFKIVFFIGRNNWPYILVLKMFSGFPNFKFFYNKVWIHKYEYIEHQIMTFFLQVSVQTGLSREMDCLKDQLDVMREAWHNLSDTSGRYEWEEPELTGSDARAHARAERLPSLRSEACLLKLQAPLMQVILASHWSILLILSSHWSLLLILSSHWSILYYRGQRRV